MSQRTHSTPTPPPGSRGYETFTGAVHELASQSRPAWPAEVRAPADAPNIIVILLDDMGFSDIAPFGSEIDTPWATTLAETGYRLTNYQTTPVCSPARAALLTGLNPHRAGFWSVAHSDPGFPGATLELGDSVPTLAESLNAAGYATFMVGKWHLTKESKLHDAADKSSWPIQRGFDRYFGCMDGFTQLHHPHRLIRDNSALQIDDYPDGYYLTDDLTDNAVEMINALRANDPTKPFFLYYAHQAVHGPLQAKPADISKYHGTYDGGWDTVRAQRFAKQLQDGLFPPGTECAPRNSEAGMAVPEWQDLEPEQRDLYARYMEVYAAAVDNVDQNLGRLISHLKDLGEYDNTIIVFTSDNGATGEGGEEGTRSYFSRFGQSAGLPEEWQVDVPRDPALIGGPQTCVHYPRGWAYASNTPFRLYKGHTYAGGIRVPMIISWPQGLPRHDDDNGIRKQYAYVSDLGPTLMQLAGVKPLTERHGLAAPEIDGMSFEPFLRNKDKETEHSTQYSEYTGRRAYIDNDWKALTAKNYGPDWATDEWKLYNLREDPTEITDLASQHPELVHELSEKWRDAAWSNTVFPLNDDGSMSRLRPATERRLETPVVLYPNTPTLERFRSSKLIKLRSFDIEVVFDADEHSQGVLLAHGDQGGGYSFTVQDREVTFAYNQYGRMIYRHLPIDAGITHTLTASFQAQSDLTWSVSLALGEITVSIDRVLQLCGMAPFTGISVGADRGGPVDWNTFAQHRSFPYSDRIYHARYLPGPKAAYNPEQLIEIERATIAVYE
ncbi:arylsulfatase [Rhodococcus sp. SC4]|nr:arylsulfatase [Rhodococcus sp. SC4]